MNLDFDDDENVNDDKIYVDFYADELSEVDPHSFRKGIQTWGVYDFQPQCQQIWSENVKAAALQIASSEDYCDIRPKMQDKISG